MNDEEIAVLKVSPATADQLHDVEDTDIFDGPLDLARVAALVATPGHALFIAKVRGVVVGQLTAMVQRQLFGPDALFVDNLGVAEGWRRRGVATALWCAACDWGRAEGCGTVWVPTEEACSAARGLYKALGLEEGSAITFEAPI